jgi:uncharacterized protein (TIGR02271 family)
MPTRKQKVVVGVFRDVESARAAVADLIKAGFTEDQVGLVARDGSVHTVKGKKKETGTAWEEGALAGVATGAGVGALWAIGIMAGLLPAIGPLIVGGPLAAILASAAGGAATLGIVGALVGLGIPEEDAHYYEGEFKAGHTIVTVKANGRAHEALEIIRNHGGYNRELGPVETTETTETSHREKLTAPRPLVGMESSSASHLTSSEEEESATIEVHEEKARVRKKPVKKGEVRVRKEVVTDQETITVPVEHEEVVIKRRPARSRKPSGTISEGEEIRVPVTEEQIHIEKEVVPTEEVEVGKRKVHDTETVTTPVRREEVKIEEEGETRTRRRSTRKK